MTDNPFFKYDIDSLSFVERAEAQLRLFDIDENVSSLLYAALELRLGIEALLHERLDAAHAAESTKRTSQKRYKPKILRGELLNLRPDAGEESKVLIGRKGSSSEVSSFRYVPVTEQLTDMLGKLGKFLHFSLFYSVSEWYLKKPSDPESKETLIPDRLRLQEVCDELRKCSSGDMVLPMRIRQDH
jgi:hypothetical protein